eukprot:GILJ01001043.1.p1 GENE.GILJ01001043.1~~GILJ01001043.1.p1  ORF type:complete len:325 (-),score=44.90 GILJ01001043.1:178-1152(-)
MSHNRSSSVGSTPLTSAIFSSNIRPEYPSAILPPYAQFFREKRVIVTGASSGIGRAIALRFLQAGAWVVLMGRRQDKLNEVAGAPTSVGVGFPIAVDLSDPLSTEIAFKQAMASLGRLDILINAGGSLRGLPLTETSLEEWDRAFSVNVRSVMQMMSMAVPFLTVSKGTVINISSIAGQKALPGAAAYSVAKSCVDMMTKCAALELAERGVRVNAVAPGVTDTEARMAREGNGLSRGQNRTFMEEAAIRAPLNTVASVWDIADSALFLASEDASFITGTILNVDGGRSVTSSGWEQWRQDQMSGLEKLGSKASRFFKWTHFKDV